MIVVFIVSIVFIHSDQKINLNHIKKYVKIKDICNFVMPSEDTKI